MKIKILSYLVVFLLGMVTTLALLHRMYPWVMIEEMQSVKTDDPFAVRIILVNRSLMSVHNIQVKCAVFSIEGKGSRKIIETSFVDPEGVKRDLKPLHRTTLTCTPEVPNADSITMAALSVTVSFEPYTLPWEWRREEPPFIYRLERVQGEHVVWHAEG